MIRAGSGAHQSRQKEPRLAQLKLTPFRDVCWGMGRGEHLSLFRVLQHTEHNRCIHHDRSSEHSQLLSRHVYPTSCISIHLTGQRSWRGENIGQVRRPFAKCANNDRLLLQAATSSLTLICAEQTTGSDRCAPSSRHYNRSNSQKWVSLRTLTPSSSPELSPLHSFNPAYTLRWYRMNDQTKAAITNASSLSQYGS
jgi:hypothetical protein